MVAPPPISPAATAPLIAAILSPSASPDPYALAELLKDPAAVAALEAHEAIQNLRLRLQVVAVSAKAVARLDTLLDTSEDPVEVRRIASILERFQSRGRGKPASLKDAAGASPDPGADPDDAFDDEPDPLDDPLNIGASNTPPLPNPEPQPSPAATVAVQIQALRQTPSARDITRVLGRTVVNLYKSDPDLFLPGLLTSPAWTHRNCPAFPGEPTIHGDTATLPVAYQPPSTGRDTLAPRISCTFHLRRDISTCGPIWKTDHITTNTS